MIIFEESTPITPELYRLFNPGPDDLLDDETEFMSKKEIEQRRLEGLLLHHDTLIRDKMHVNLGQYLFGA